MSNTSDFDKLSAEREVAVFGKNPTPTQIAQYNDDVIAYKVKYGHWPQGKGGKDWYVDIIGARPNSKTTSDQLYLTDPKDLANLYKSGAYKEGSLIKHTAYDGSVYYVGDGGDTVISFVDLENYSGRGVFDNTIDYTPGPIHKPPPLDDGGDDDKDKVTINWEYIGLAAGGVVVVGALIYGLS